MEKEQHAGLEGNEKLMFSKGKHKIPMLQKEEQAEKLVGA